MKTFQVVCVSIFFFLIAGCGKGSKVTEVSIASLDDYIGPVIAAEAWAIEDGEVKTLRISNIVALEEGLERSNIILIYGKNRMLEIAARDYYRRLKERAENPGIFWYARGLKGLDILILERSDVDNGEEKVYAVKVDAITGVTESNDP